MAEVLVLVEDRPVKDSADRWYRGMPVIVKPNGWRWGRLERPPKFIVLEFPRLSVEEAVKEFMEQDLEDSLIGNREVDIYARRKYRIDETRLQLAEARPEGKLRLLHTKENLSQIREAFPRDPIKRPPRRELRTVMREALHGRHR
jgi:hypothetical protein